MKEYDDSPPPTGMLAESGSSLALSDIISSSFSTLSRTRVREGGREGEGGRERGGGRGRESCKEGKDGHAQVAPHTLLTTYGISSFCMPHIFGTPQSLFVLLNKVIELKPSWLATKSKHELPGSSYSFLISLHTHTGQGIVLPLQPVCKFVLIIYLLCRYIHATQLPSCKLSKCLHLELSTQASGNDQGMTAGSCTASQEHSPMHTAIYV